MGEELRVRAAYPREIGTLVEFNRRMARETEERELDPEVLRAGVQAVFDEPARGTYFLALAGERPLGGLLITGEWSDWRNGLFWWIQSVYVVPEARRRGVFRALYRHVLERAHADPGVCGLRLYVEHGNRGAQEVYRRLGMREARYRFLEVDFALAANAAGGDVRAKTGPPGRP